jgi:hypothetical protein
MKAQRRSGGIAVLFLQPRRQMEVVYVMSRPLYLRERVCTHCTGGWVCPRADLDGCGMSRPHRGFFMSSCTVFVLHPYSVLSFYCPAFCLFVFTYNTQHKHSCLWRDLNPQPQPAIGRRPSHLSAPPIGSANSISGPSSP